MNELDIFISKENAGLGHILSKGINQIYQYVDITAKDNVECRLHWNHFKTDTVTPEHYEDEETVIDVFNFLQKRVVSNLKINYSHHLHTPIHYTKNQIQKGRQYKPYMNMYGDRNVVELYNPHKTIKNKLCFWGVNKNLISTDGTNPDLIHQNWRHQNFDDWLKIKKFLSQHYDLVEVSYRLPIREVYYHLATSEFAFGYAGAFHTLSIMLRKPTILTVGLNNKLYPETMKELKALDEKIPSQTEYKSFHDYLVNRLYPWEALWYNDTVDEVCNLDKLLYYKNIAFSNMNMLKQFWEKFYGKNG